MLSTKLKEAAGNSADATLYVDDVFSTYLYTGNGSTQTITNGIDLAGKGGLVWIKNRSDTNPHVLSNTNSGITNYCSSDSTSAQSSGGTDFITTANSNGFSVGVAGSVNFSTNNYASWTFRKAAKFFDVVTYTGNGVAGRTIAHSLGVAPGMVIVKRTDTTENWKVGIRGIYNLCLNLTDAEGATTFSGGNTGSYTSTTFTLNSYASSLSAVNASGATYVAYLFAHDTSSTGIIQCGSYVGNGLTAGPNITLGWEPQYLMVKNASGTGNWQVIDSMRGMPVGSADATLQANLANAESSVEYLSPTATGFQITSTSTEVNTSGSTYIYMAIRRPNKPPTTGTQVYNAITRTGTGAAATVTGVGFAPDFVMSKVTDVATSGDGFLADKLRGVGNRLIPAVAAAQQSTPDGVTAFNMNGITLGTDATTNNINSSSFSYINWFFKRAPGFFDEVCYTGTGVGMTQAHNLGVVPELMIVKERSATNNWWVYDAIDGNTKYSVLNSTAIPAASSTAWNNTTPTASVFSIGTGANVNASTQTFVAYLFATLAGISKVGSYTGNGTGQAIACGFSAGARFVLIKRTDSTGGWYTFDSARGLTSGSSPYLLLNSTAAEVTGNNGVYASTGGFTLGSTASTTTNINGASYIYLSVA